MSYQLCVMGNPIQHSKSPWIHAEFAQQLKIKITYTTIEPEIHAFAKALAQFRKDQGHGLNVTLPFKQQAYQLASKTSERAAIAKAVNTIRFDADGIIYGDNTDGVGFIRDVTQNLSYSLAGKKILILGAGGATRGILHPVLSQNPAAVIIANRKPENARLLAIDFKSYGNIRACDLEGLDDLKIDVIINGTALDSGIVLPASLAVSENSLAYDLNYNNNSTTLMTWAKTKNVPLVKNGIGMLIEQAAEAFFVWTGQRPDTRPIINRQHF